MFRCRNSAPGTRQLYKQHNRPCQQSGRSSRRIVGRCIPWECLWDGDRCQLQKPLRLQRWRESVLPRVPRRSVVRLGPWQTAQVICCLPTTATYQERREVQVAAPEVLTQTWPVSLHVSLICKMSGILGPQTHWKTITAFPDNGL